MLDVAAALGLAAVFLLDPQSAPAPPRSEGEEARQADPATPAPQDPADAPVSTGRVSRALRRPATLRLTSRDAEQPLFRAEVEAIDWSTPSILETIRGELAASPGRPAPFQAGGVTPAATVDLLQLAVAIKDRIAASRRAGAERDIKRRVREELAAFCAAQDCSVVEGQEP
jgi:hypothetical protein